MLSERIGAMSAGDLKASLDEDEDPEEAWAIEVERRIAEIESGAVPVIPIEQALSQVRSALTSKYG
jgi:putative addiction module component (TIGR02574 family)